MITKKDLVNHIEKNWNLPSYEIDKALRNMDRMRCPLYQANSIVEEKLNELIDDFLCDNGLENDWFANNYDSVEELFWEIDFDKI